MWIIILDIKYFCWKISSNILPSKILKGNIKIDVRNGEKMQLTIYDIFSCKNGICSLNFESNIDFLVYLH